MKCHNSTFGPREPARLGLMSEAHTAAAGSTLIRNVRVFDGHQTLGATSVLITDGRISAVEADLVAPDTATVVDGAGGMLLPGLIDAHTHTTSVPDLEQALAFGVTTELDMFSTPELLTPLRAAAATRVDVADLRSAGVGATAPGGHPTDLVDMGVFPAFPTLSGEEDPGEFVADRVAEGSDYIKLIVDDGQWLGTPIPTLSQPQIQQVVAAAHQHCKQAIAHASTHAETDQALTAGVDGLAHVPLDLDPPTDFGHQAKRAGVFVIPTLSVWEAKFGYRRETALATDPRLHQFIAPASLDYLSGTWAEVFGADQPDWPGPVYAKHATEQLHQAGVPLLAGTDAATPRSVHGLNMHGELAALVEAGLSPPEALTTATATPAKCFGLTDRGRIKTGSRADLLLVAGDPTHDITATTGILGVWRHGHRLDREPQSDSATSQKEVTRQPNRR